MSLIHDMYEWMLINVLNCHECLQKPSGKLKKHYNDRYGEISCDINNLDDVIINRF